MNAPILTRREPILVLLFSIFSLGFYLPFWYHGVYQDLVRLDGRTPTGRGYWLDFLLVIFTFAIYGIWVDYRISIQISEFEERNGLGPVQDTSVIAVILDVASYFTAFFTNFVTSAIQQDQLNRLADKIDERLLTEAGVLA
jgi:hypothetical protein